MSATPESMNEQCDSCGEILDSSQIGLCDGCRVDHDGWKNFYHCSCGEEWEDNSDSCGNDRCPACNREIEPYISDDGSLSDDAIELARKAVHELIGPHVCEVKLTVISTPGLRYVRMIADCSNGYEQMEIKGGSKSVCEVRLEAFNAVGEKIDNLVLSSEEWRKLEGNDDVMTIVEQALVSGRKFKHAYADLK
jgi:hypothetical protein